jgi:hypothetical protein
MTRIRMIEGRGGSRIDSEEGGRHLGIPRNRAFPSFRAPQPAGGVPPDMRAKSRRPKTIPPWVVPPRSVVKCVAYSKRTGAYKADLGHHYRIGYYGACRDGLDVVWLVNERGDYVATTDHNDLRRYFRVVRRSDETDYFGDGRRPLRALPGWGERARRGKRQPRRRP